ncbi:4Fe-4S binding protein [Paracoccus limosus]|uniref:4Fe-4S binding protein n=1 Tax=Paracoccus limosus TaxID=913252 RepID=A0A844H7D0_9RHOB|nr:NosR/NirI family protein [Paracoccus limosus]MTH34397.1 4Fe-4S binding protein [Paracoccus limosus]
MSLPRLSNLARHRLLWLVVLCLLSLGGAAQAMTLAQALDKTPPAQLFAGADAYGAPQGDPAIVPVLKAGQLQGYAYLNSDFTPSTGYSGKPIRIVVGIDPKGVIRGINLVEHHEPIVLIGIPEAKVLAALNGLIGTDLAQVASGAVKPPQAEIVSGATVTVLVMGDSIVRSAVKLIRSGRLDGVAAGAAPVEVKRQLDPAVTQTADWQTLLGDGSVRSLVLTVGEVSKAFADAGQPAAAGHPEDADPAAPFISLYMAPVSVPAIGRSLLGDVAYERMAAKLQPGQSAVLVAGDGAYSFKGSGYVRGGIFDRIELMQDGQGLRFHDHDHTRLPVLAAQGAPHLKEIALFVVPQDFTFDPTEPFDLQLLVQRQTEGRDKATLPFDLAYQIPERYLLPAAAPAPVAVPAASPVQAAQTGQPMPEDDGPALWKTMWQMNHLNLAILGVALAVLTAIFFFQDVLTKYPRSFLWTRRAYLSFTLIWLGWIVHTQLSVVNVLTFANALLSGFSWEYFLSAPLVFVLWCAVAAGLLFWGRGPFCGWLCPFGALQELSNTVARKLRVPQIDLPWGLHERLWPIKYMIFLGLFGLSLYSLSDAEVYAEVEPFKTAIILKFMREWGFVLFALACLLPGLFIERFYCRYMCPLGAALAIPGRMRMFEWLKRWPECGSPCQRCANDCPVKAIHPEGQINVNECIYCMNCQVLYHDDTRCPHMITQKARREKIARSAQPGSGTKPAPVAQSKDAHAQPPAFRAQKAAVTPPPDLKGA